MTAGDMSNKFELEIWKRNDDGLWRIDFKNNRGEGIREKGMDFTETIERGFRHLMKSLELDGLEKLHR